MATKKAEKPKERYVLVTTSYRGVFAGYLVEDNGDVVKLRQARNCVYWPAEQKGFLGLAKDGPVSGSRIGPAADVELRAITCIAEVTDEARLRWESAPWR